MPYKNIEEGKRKKREYYQLHKERFKAASRANRRKNPAADKLRHERYREKNKDRLIAAKNKWVAENKDRLKEYHGAWAKENRLSLREYHAQWRKKNPELVFNHSVNNKAKRRAVTSIGKITRGLIRKLMNSQMGLCAICSKELQSTGFHRDHVIPLCKGGRHEDSNIQLLCPPCNLSKGGKIIDIQKGSA